jgi:hypothetical protein
MATRPFTDIAEIDDTLPIKNGTVTITCTKKGYYQTYDRFVLNTPAIGDIEAKYGYRFYNGVFVTLTGDQTIIGG